MWAIFMNCLGSQMEVFEQFNFVLLKIWAIIVNSLGSLQLFFSH